MGFTDFGIYEDQSTSECSIVDQLGAKTDGALLVYACGMVRASKHNIVRKINDHLDDKLVYPLFEIPGEKPSELISIMRICRDIGYYNLSIECCDRIKVKKYTIDGIKFCHLFFI